MVVDNLHLVHLVEVSLESLAVVQDLSLADGAGVVDSLRHQVRPELSHILFQGRGVVTRRDVFGQRAVGYHAERGVALEAAKAATVLAPVAPPLRGVGLGHHAPLGELGSGVSF